MGAVGALAAVRVAIPLAALAASGRALPGLPRYEYDGLTGDATGFYAATREFIASRRDVHRPPYEDVADFEEYTRLYRESWSEPVMRWLLSTIATAMIFDDHDVHDDWNISA
ncbi:MAG: hypothetical protein M3321_01395, partial [Actinomycetota bacterium]|nr:hypothetical protein [Actinomycetota bacterium]